jgi:hypothetical protein
VSSNDAPAMPDTGHTFGRDAAAMRPARPGPTFLIYFHITVSCISLVYVTYYFRYFLKTSLDEGRFYAASFLILVFALISPLFTFARFSFGYFLGFYFYTMVIGFLWLSHFTSLSYDHDLARISAGFSIIGFLLPSLFITSSLKPMDQKPAYEMSASTLEYVLHAILILTAAVVIFGASLNFRLVSIRDIYNFRDALEFPVVLQYLIGICSGALLPFAFACFVTMGRYWRATFVLILLLALYPITLSKVALLAPPWLLAMAFLSKYFESRTATVLSLLLPLLAGLILIVLVPGHAILYFGHINFRMIAIPSSALDYYNEFFATHELTYFCQISFLKSIVNCPYDDPLSIVMARAYSVGNFNGSLFTTEGIASVGLSLSPIAALVCGLVVAFGNRISSHLPARFILMSGAILPQLFLNVPLTTVMLTNGAGTLFFLWYLVPRTMFERG